MRNASAAQIDPKAPTPLRDGYRRVPMTRKKCLFDLFQYTLCVAAAMFIALSRHQQGRGVVDFIVCGIVFLFCMGQLCWTVGAYFRLRRGELVLITQSDGSNNAPILLGLGGLAVIPVLCIAVARVVTPTR
ncbi:MAG: hypothetical protein ABIY70_24385 [Capsulimonas sp.]|uniref:hypothetical protein n=1 Tax=Capsulimonas sp. TaxID=2494211 RepID=UPI00326569DB